MDDFVQSEHYDETEAAPEAAGTELKKKELIDLVVERSGIKKKDAKPVVEATLAVLGELLADGREMNLRPMGKIKINRVKEVNNGKVLVARIRQPQVVEGDEEAESSED